MSHHKDHIKIGLGLFLLSVLLHGLHFMIFRDMHHLLIFLLSDLAFIPLEVLFVTLVIDRVLEGREKEKLNEKLNMLIGLFFQELGMKLLRVCTDADMESETLRSRCHITIGWEEAHYNDLTKYIKQLPLKIHFDQVNMEKLCNALVNKKEFMTSLIANPALLEHDTFSDVLMAVNHLHEELTLRVKLNGEDPSRHDQEHLETDIERVYGLLIQEWILYMKHLKIRYPYLFATAMINNPFEKLKRTEVEKEVRSQLYT